MRRPSTMMRAVASKAERSFVLTTQRRRGRVTRTDSHLCIDLSTGNKFVDDCEDYLSKQKGTHEDLAAGGAAVSDNLAVNEVQTDSDLRIHESKSGKPIITSLILRL
jgi:hypothetical protein